MNSRIITRIHTTTSLISVALRLSQRGDDAPGITPLRSSSQRAVGRVLRFFLTCLEAPGGIEPPTSSLPRKCTTSVLRSHKFTPVSTGVVVQAKGVEPLILAATASKTVMYTSSNTPANITKNTYLYSRHYCPLEQSGSQDKVFLSYLSYY